jgi:hypothetical protein
MFRHTLPSWLGGLLPLLSGENVTERRTATKAGVFLQSGCVSSVLFDIFSACADRDNQAEADGTDQQNSPCITVQSWTLLRRMSVHFYTTAFVWQPRIVKSPKHGKPHTALPAM